MNIILKRIRDRIGLSQPDMAEAIGIPQSTLSLYERTGTPIPPSVGQSVIETAKTHGLLIDFNHLYAGVQLPPGEDRPRAKKPRGKNKARDAQ